MLVLCACAVAPPPQQPQGQGKLQKATRKASQPSSGGSSGGGSSHGSGHSSSYSGSSSWDDEDESFGDMVASAVGEVVLWTVASPFWLPHHLMEERPGDLQMGYYLAHPYPADDRPFLATSDADPDYQALSFRSQVEYGNDFDGVERLGVSLRMETAVRLGIDSSWSRYEEDLPGGTTDTLNLGDVDLTYRFAQSGDGEMRAGFGLNWLADGPVHETGFNFTYGGDFYPGAPWITSFEFDVGTLGEVTRFHGRATVGAALGCGELNVGFDYETLDSASLPTWTVGLRLWF